MAMCTFDSDAAEMAKAASDLYSQSKSGNSEARLDFLNVMQGINYNQECSGHDAFVKDVFDHLSGPLSNDAILATGKRAGYPRLDEQMTVSEIHIPPLEQVLHPKSK